MTDTSTTRTPNKVLLLSVILFAIISWWAIYGKQVAESSLAETEASLVLAQKGKTFYLLEADGNCQQVTIRFSGDRLVWIAGTTVVGVKKAGATFVKSEAGQFECQLSVAMALQ